jgi:hypothetical protein
MDILVELSFKVHRGFEAKCAVALHVVVKDFDPLECKNRLAVRIMEYMGPDILIEVRHLPGWRNDLNTREKLACRCERRN